MKKYLPIVIPVLLVLTILFVIFYFLKENTWNSLGSRNLSNELKAGRKVEVLYKVTHDSGRINDIGLTENMYTIHYGEVTADGTDIIYNKFTSYNADGSERASWSAANEAADWRARWTGSGKTPPTAFPRFPTIDDMKNGTVPSRKWASGTIPADQGHPNDVCATAGEVINKMGTWKCEAPTTGTSDTTWKYLRHSDGKYLAVPGNSGDSGKQLVQWGKTNEYGQLWNMSESDGNGKFYIKNKHGKYLQAFDGNDGAKVTQEGKNINHQGQRWSWDGVRLKNNYGKYLMVWGNGFLSNSMVSGNYDANAKTQEWTWDS